MDSDKIIEMVYLATGSYKQFIKEFLDSIHLFFPGYKKIITILSDDLNIYRKFECDNIVSITVHKLVHLPYPFISYFKFNYIKEYCSRQADYLFYFDADTIFVENEQMNFDKILSLMDNSILLSLHPFYTLDVKEMFVPSFFEYNTERNDRYSTYIERYEYNYVIGSFFGGSTSNVLKMCDSIIDMMSKDLIESARTWYIPKFMDESYLNSIAFNNKEFNFIKEQFVVLYNETSLNDYTFCKQKWFPNEKEERVEEGI